MEKNKGGRPTKMTPEIQQQILDRIVQGESLVKILNSSERFPVYSKFMAFVDQHPEFRDKYAQAKEEQADFLAEEILDIADESACDYKMIERDGRQVEVVDHEHIQRSRLRVDTRKWIASKLKPKKYGERVNNILTGDPEKPLEMNHNLNFKTMTDDDLNRYLDQAKKG